MWLKRGVSLLIYFNIRVILGDLCVEEKTCSACINYAKERCVWCPSKDHLNGEPRCRSQSYIAKNSKWCVGEVYDPESEKNYSKNNNASRLQFTPTYLKVKLRPNVPIHFTMQYTPAKDQPLDVYLLLDNSGSMEGLRDELSRIAIQLQADLTSISNNVFMGVGSFIEKPAKPYTVSNLDTYSFKNDLPLTNNMSLLSKTLNSMKSGKNSDGPEAGLDALMQVMVCDKEIGWRPQARRMIVYASDETYHVCGDGKMVGAIKPNDMKCHLENNIHTTALEYDYPSPGRLDKIANDKGITTIFVIKPNDLVSSVVTRAYKRLAKTIKNAQFSKMNNYNDIANIIITNYKNLKKSVLITYDRLPNVELKLSPDCTISKNKKCELGHKESIIINATLSLTSCSEDSKYIKKMLVGTMDLQSNEKLTIEIVKLCKCECENKGIASAPQCSNHGTYQCGICDCNKDRVGDTCECDRTKIDSSKKKCNSEFCNGRGSCVCGQCHCFPGFGGNACELSDTDCKLYNGKLCAGHGTCVKSKCICDKEWTSRDDCSCSSDKSSCYPPESTDVEPEIHCSNNGVCICNKCKCKKEYSGEYCDYCLECEKKTCKDLRDYAQCVFSENKTICDEKFNKFPLDIDSVLITEKAFDSENKTATKTLICKITFENGSAINSRYGFEPSLKKWILEVQNELQDPPKANIWVPIGAVIGSILLGGLLILLIWKFSMDYLDKKEYEKFKAEAEGAGFNVSLQNPCYRDPVVVFRNPKYNVKTN